MAWGQREWLLAAGGAGAALVLWRYRSLTAPISIAAGYAVNAIQRGARLSYTKAVAGVVPDDPEALVTAAGAVLGREISRDAYALARMGRSEGIDGMAFRMHVAINDLAELQRTYGTRVYSSLWALMLHSKNERSDGHFSEQGLGKRYATDEDPYAGDVERAELVLEEHGQGVDPTGGAVKFVDKDSFGVQPGTKTYAETADDWAADGLEPATLEGASSNFVIFRRAA